MKSVQQILTDMNRSFEGPGEKTAAAAAPSVSHARQDLDESLTRVLGRDKQAAATGPGVTGQLEKIARDLADADEIATIKEGQLYGAAVFDGFISRANQYAQHAPAQEKAASYVDNDEAYKVAAQLGYQAMNDATQPRRKTAAENQQELLEGIDDGLNKVAAASINCFERGFQHMQKIAAVLMKEGEDAPARWGELDPKKYPGARPTKAQQKYVSPIAPNREATQTSAGGTETLRRWNSNAGPGGATK